jgi:hypothetical protein
MSRPLRINIISKGTGGLARDVKLLSDSLQSSGCEVFFCRMDAARRRQRRSMVAQLAVRGMLALDKLSGVSRAGDADVNLMLEHVWPQYLRSARLNVAVPNPEFFDRHDVRFLSRIDHVWAKTRTTHGIFRKLGCATSFIGFDSEDRYVSTGRRERTFFHLAGMSTMKGTDRLLRVWARNAHWPRLIVVHHPAADHAPEVSGHNIERRVGYLDDMDLKLLQNTSMFHVCLSLTEGWGHYIVEALSVGAVPLTLDAAPMNELVTAERGLLVPYRRTGSQKLATTYAFDEAGLEAAVERAVHMPDDELRSLSESARRWFVLNRSTFAGRLQAALRDLQLPATTA